MEEKQLIDELKKSFGVTLYQAKALRQGLCEALDYHNTMGAMYCSEIAINEYRDNIESACDAIRKLNISLKQLPESERLILDDYYRESNGGDKLMISIADEKMFSAGIAQSGFYEISQRMEKVLKIAEENIRAPGAGNARRTGKEYIAGIEMLMRWFLDVLPDKELSAQPVSYFYKYVQIWLDLNFHSAKENRDIRRHISNTLKHPDVRRHHVKG